MVACKYVYVTNKARLVFKNNREPKVLKYIKGHFYEKILSILIPLLAACVQPQQLRQESFLTRAHGFYAEVFISTASETDFFSLLNKQPVHSIDGWGYIMGR